MHRFVSPKKPKSMHSVVDLFQLFDKQINDDNTANKNRISVCIRRFGGPWLWRHTYEPPAASPRVAKSEPNPGTHRRSTTAEQRKCPASPDNTTTHSRANDLQDTNQWHRATPTLHTAMTNVNFEILLYAHKYICTIPCDGISCSNIEKSLK